MYNGPVVLKQIYWSRWRGVYEICNYQASFVSFQDFFNQTQYRYVYRDMLDKPQCGLSSFEDYTEQRDGWYLCDQTGAHIIQPEAVLWVALYHGHLTHELVETEWMRKKGWTYAKNFRCGPVPGVHKRHGRFCQGIRTTQEHRENDFLNYDEDAREYHIRARGSRYKELPDTWDDFAQRRHHEKNWKRQRKTRWR
jgi:hypothetical protein